MVQKHRDNPVMEYGKDDPALVGAIPADELIRRKPTEKPRRAEYDDESDGDGIVSDGNEDFLFPAGGPTSTGPRTAAAALEQLKKKRRLRRKAPASDDEGTAGLDDETLEQRRKAREAADLEKRLKIKSAEFISDSEDDVEADKIFFEREEARRKGHAAKVMKVLKEGMVDRKKKRKSDDEEKEPKKRVKKQEKRVESESEEEDDSDSDLQFPAGSSSPRLQDLWLESQSDDEDTPLSTPLEDARPDKVLRDVPVNVQPSEDSMGGDKVSMLSTGEDAADEDDEDMPLVVQSRRRQRGAFVFDSDSD